MSLTGTGLGASERSDAPGRVSVMGGVRQAVLRLWSGLARRLGFAPTPTVSAPGTASGIGSRPAGGAPPEDVATFSHSPGTETTVSDWLVFEAGWEGVGEPHAVPAGVLPRTGTPVEAGSAEGSALSPDRGRAHPGEEGAASAGPLDPSGSGQVARPRFSGHTDPRVSHADWWTFPDADAPARAWVAKGAPTRNGGLRADDRTPRVRHGTEHLAVTVPASEDGTAERPVAGAGSNPAGKSATSPGNAGWPVGLAQAPEADGVTGSDVKAEARSAEGDAPVSETADTAATGPSVKTPFRLVVHFAGPDRIRGGEGRDFLHGTPSNTDDFDADAGGDDILFGMSGDDVYWLGPGTGRDTIVDSGGTGDVIRLKDGLTADNVRLVVDGSERLHVLLVDAAGAETDRYTVAWDPGFGVDRVELSDGETVFDERDLAHAWHDFVESAIESGPDVIRRLGGPEFTLGGEAGVRLWTGSRSADSFLTGGVSSDEYRGRGGNDIYWLGTHSGHDRVNEHEGNPVGDPGDAIVVKSGISAPRRGLGADLESAVPVGGGPTAWVRWSQDGRDLVIDVVERQLDGQVTTHSSLTVDEFFFRDNAQVEQIVFANNSWATMSLRELRSDRIRGIAGSDFLHGTAGTDHFDADKGGDDVLFGMSGDDIYWLGPGTGKDTIVETEGSENVIRLESGLTADDVRLVRDMRGYHVLLVDADGTETDRYTVARGFGVRRVELSNEETVFDENDFAVAPFTPLPRPARPSASWLPEALPIFNIPTLEDLLSGRNLNNAPRLPNIVPVVGTSGTDHFDTSGGSQDILWGLSGDDVYWLGRGTGKDRILDVDGPGDTIRLKTGLAADDVRLIADTEDFHVLLVDSTGAETDRYTIAGGLDSSVKRVEMSNGETVFDEGDFVDVWEQLNGVRDVVRNLIPVVGTSGTDHFDTSGGSHDTLWGLSGDDVYWLGRGTGKDRIVDVDGAGDTIRLKFGLVADDVRLISEKKDFHVRLVDSTGAETDRYTIAGGLASSVKRVELWNGETVFDKDDFFGAWEQLGTSGFVVERGLRLYAREDYYDRWSGSQTDDSFLVGSPFRTDEYRGFGGNDVYWLGITSGHDTVSESWGNPSGSPKDAIVVESGISAPRQDMDWTQVWNQVHRRRGRPLLNELDRSGDFPIAWVHRTQSGRGLVIDVVERLSDGTLVTHSSLTVYGFFEESSARVEKIVFADDPQATLTWGDLSELPYLPIIDGPGDDELRGGIGPDVFDSSEGGNDKLYGDDGDDTYYLGVKTGIDTVIEYDNSGQDRVVVKEGIRIPEPDQIWRMTDNAEPTLRVRRGDHSLDLALEVTVNGEVVGALIVEGQYASWRKFPIDGFYDADGREVISLDEAMALRRVIAGGTGNDFLSGQGSDDHFDISAGGNDLLSGRLGSDVYWLGSGGNSGTGRIYEGDPSSGPGAPDDFDVIRLTEDISSVGEDGRRRSLEIWRSNDGDDLHVAFLVDGDVASSYIVVDQYEMITGDSGTVRGRAVHISTGADGVTRESVALGTMVEAILSVDGHVIHDADDLDKARIVGGDGDDNLYGNDHLDDHFDGRRGGSDALYGVGGDDVYWLGRGTGSDRVHEHMEAVWRMRDGSVKEYGPWPPGIWGWGARMEHRHRMAHSQDESGDSGDTIRIASPHIGRSDVGVVREGSDLIVRLLGDEGRPTDSLTVVDHFADEVAQVERIELNGKALLIRDLIEAVDLIARFNAGSSWGVTLDILPDSLWRDPSDFLGGPTA